MTTQVVSQALIEMQSKRQWVCWCYEPDENGRMTKVPYQVKNGYKASTRKPEQWASYADAVRVQKFGQNADDKPYDGIGFVFNNDYTGVDWDHCINEDGSIEPWAKEEIDRLATYCEKSPSETGIHGITRALLPEVTNAKGEKERKGKKVRLPGKNHPDAAIEMYCQGRFFTVTGNHLPGTPETIEERQEVITALHTKYFSKKKQESRSSPRFDNLSDQELIEKACRASNGTQFRDLWHGNTSAYGDDHSVADIALCSHLAFWTGKDAARMDRLFRQSGLYREKWERDARSGETYGEGTIREVIERCKETYDPGNYSAGKNGHIPPNEQEATGSFHLTDLGNAERFKAKYKDKVRWCETWKTWLIFNGRCWEPDRSGRVDQFAKIVVRSIYKEAAAEPDEVQRKRIAKHANASESNRAVRAMLDRAKSELPAVPDDFNQQLHLLNFKNGTLDLRTGELRPHSPHDMLIRCLKYNYNPLAPFAKWEAFIKSIFNNDADLIAFVKESLGMTLSGNIREQCWFLCHGEGNNGKTTLLETIRSILEEYALAANIETFQVRKGDRINNDVAEFYGKRMITASENQVGSRLNEGFIKKITGNEPLRARRLHENEFQFMPECTIWLAVNHKPIVKDNSKGMWRRVRFIPFNVTIEDSQIDTELPTKLLAEAEGILAWLVQGCLAWYKRGRLDVPEAVKSATKNYQREMDSISRFIADECEFREGVKISTSDLNYQLVTWCEQHGDKEKADTKELKNALNKRGYFSKRGTGGKYYYQGVCLKPGNDDPPKSEGSEGSEPESTVSTREENTSQKMGESSSITFTTVTSELKFSEESEGTFTQDDEDPPKKSEKQDKVPSLSEDPRVPKRACYRCQTRNWEWDEALERAVCVTCGNGGAL